MNDLERLERLEILYECQRKKVDELQAAVNSLYKGLKDISDSDTQLSQIIIQEIEKLTLTVNNLKK